MYSSPSGPTASCGNEDAQKRKKFVRGRNSVSLKTDATVGVVHVRPASVERAT